MYITCNTCDRELMSGKTPMAAGNPDFVCVDCDKHPAAQKQVEKLRKQLREVEDEISFLRDNVNSLFQRVAKKYEGKLPDEVILSRSDVQDIWSALFPNGCRDHKEVENYEQEIYCNQQGLFWASRLFDKPTDVLTWTRLAEMCMWHKKIMGFTDGSYSGAEKFLAETKEKV